MKVNICLCDKSDIRMEHVSSRCDSHLSFGNGGKGVRYRLYIAF